MNLFTGIKNALSKKDKKEVEVYNKGLEKTEVISDNSLISTEKKSNKKVLIITLLSILLAIDVAALVIYLIGIEKVISFIK